MHGVTIGTIGNLEIVRGVKDDAGHVQVRFWDGKPNEDGASVDFDITLTAAQAGVLVALLGLAG